MVGYLHLWAVSTRRRFSDPSKPVTAAAMAAMEKWQNKQGAGSISFYISYGYWNGNANYYPLIYRNLDPTDGEYPMRVGRGNDSSIIIVSDLFQEINGVPRNK